MSGSVRSVTGHGNGVSESGKSGRICSIRLKLVFAEYEKYGTLSINVWGGRGAEGAAGVGLIAIV